MVDKWGELTSISETSKPSHVDVAEWVINSHATMPKQIIRNAWTKMGYAWYDKQRDDVILNAYVNAITITNNDDYQENNDHIATTDNESDDDMAESDNDHDNT